MRKSMQLRWIEQSEARAVWENARLLRAVSEPHISIRSDITGTSWVDWLKVLLRLFRSTTALRKDALATAMIFRARSRAFGRAATELDYDRVLVAILITDIVDSTRRVAEMGDRDWRQLLDRHADATRSQIRRFGGREAGNRGYGFVGIFDSPARALRCAAAIGDTIASLGILVRSGIHVGEVYLKSEEISGIAVHVTARIAATARPGEAIVSKTVRDLVVGSGLAFEDRGIHQLRGLPEEIHLYAMNAVGAG